MVLGDAGTLISDFLTESDTNHLPAWSLLVPRVMLTSLLACEAGQGRPPHPG